MRNKILIGVLLAAAALTTVSAHVMVSPLQSKPGASQKYESARPQRSKGRRDHDRSDIPDGVIVTDVAKPASGSYTMKRPATASPPSPGRSTCSRANMSRSRSRPRTLTAPPTCTGTCANISPTVRSSTGATSQDRRRRVPSPSSPEPPTERRVFLAI